MKLEGIITLADSAYPEGLIKRAFETKKPVGDGLAEFIARELTDTYDTKASGKEQLDEAIRVMERACSELRAVKTMFKSIRAITTKTRSRL